MERTKEKGIENYPLFFPRIHGILQIKKEHLSCHDHLHKEEHNIYSKKYHLLKVIALCTGIGASLWKYGNINK